MPLPSRVSESTRRLNPGLFGAPSPAVLAAASKVMDAAFPADKPRLRQSRAPRLNKTEAAFEEHLRASLPGATVSAHPITLRIANGCRYTPDFLAVGPGGAWVRVYEVKGPKAWDDAIVKLKVAAAQFPWLSFWLATRNPGSAWDQWRLERVFP